MPHVSVKADLIHDTILQWIAEGSLTPGQKLPSEAELARRLGINSRTVRRGLAELVREGVIVKQHRVGNFVRRAAAGRFTTGIGVMLPAFLFRVESHAAPALFLRGMDQVLDPRRFSTHILPYDKWRLWEDAGQLAVDKGVAGALLWPVVQVRRSHLKRLIEAGMKLVMIQPPEALKGQGVGWIGTDVHALMRQLLEGLVQRGHQRIVIMHYEREHLWSESRRAVEAVFARHGLGSPDKAIIELDNLANTQQVHQEMSARLGGDAPPTAVIVPDEIAANTVFQFCYARGIRVPDDLSLAAMGNYAPRLNPVPLAGPDSVATRLNVVAQATRYLTGLIETEGQGAASAEAGRWLEGIVLDEPVQWNASVAPATQVKSGGVS